MLLWAGPRSHLIRLRPIQSVKEIVCYLIASGCGLKKKKKRACGVGPRPRPASAAHGPRRRERQSPAGWQRSRSPGPTSGYGNWGTNYQRSPHYDQPLRQRCIDPSTQAPLLHSLQCHPHSGLFHLQFGTVFRNVYHNGMQLLHERDPQSVLSYPTVIACAAGLISQFLVS